MTAPQGRLLGDRYALGVTLGSGGMAEVFSGIDTRLGREVAVKVLRGDLARDPSFQQRFRREAQSAAALNAPSIVSVYDTGEDTIDGVRGVPWIVMERLYGRTLREVLTQEGPLVPERALEITADVCSALEIAHDAGIVHRDIKPGNVMLTPAGEVKVMDFGIARAVAAATATATQTANVIGTAAYLSPEQARGEHVDARSDLYSAGCLLYELLTGQPPFSGDSPIAVAYQHVREDPVPPSQLDGALAPVIDAVVLKAIAKNPVNRYQTAGQMREDLLRAAADEPVDATPVLRGLPALSGSRQIATRPAARRGPVYLLFAVLLLAVAAAVALLVSNLRSRDPELVAVPQVVGLTQTDAQSQLTAAGLSVGAVRPSFSDQPEGQVLEQAPAVGTRVEQASRVNLVVSQGIEMTVVPTLVGLQQAEAEAQLQQAKLVVGEVVPRNGVTSPGEVLEEIPAAGTPLAVGATVRLVVSTGQVEVPVVVRLPQQSATQQLQQAGFNVGVRLTDDAGQPGIVLSQDPPGGLAQRGSTVSIVVSQTPPPPSPTPTPTPSRIPTPTPTPSPTRTPSPTPTDTPSPTATPTP